MVATMLGAFALGSNPVAAGPAQKGVARVSSATDISAQARRYATRPPTRFRVYPGGRLLYRDCTFRLAQQWRPSGTVIVPLQRCWWVRG